MSKVKGSQLKIDTLICIAGLHYYRVVSASSDPNGLVLALVPGITKAMQQIIPGNGSTDYHVVTPEEVEAARKRNNGGRQTVTGQATTANAKTGESVDAESASDKADNSTVSMLEFLSKK